MTRALSLLLSLPFPLETVPKLFRGECINTDLFLDLTLSRLSDGFFNGTRFEGDLTKLELQWGRTIGMNPSPYTSGNPLVALNRLGESGDFLI